MITLPRQGWNGWGLWLLVAALLAPSMALLAGLGSRGLAWLDGRGLQLTGNLGHSVVSSLLAAVTAVFLGTLLAWVMALYRFPGRRFLGFLAILPLAVPTYLAAYAQAGIMDINGPVSRLLGFLGVTDRFRWVPEGSVAFGLSMGFQLYPYVYLITLPAFRRGLQAPLEAARVLGREGAGLFFNPGLSLVWPFAAGGGALVIMESLNEYGAAVQFGVPTLTWAMFRAWTHAFNLDAALVIGCLLCLLALFAVAVERHFRAQRHFAGSLKSNQGPSMTLPAKGLHRWLLSGLFILAVVPGLLVPVFQCLWWLGIHSSTLWMESLRSLVGTLSLAMVTGVLALLTALAALAFSGGRQVRPRGTGAVSFAALFTYAMPGLALALGVLSLAASQRALMVQGGMLFLFYALWVRFFSIAHSGLHSAWRHRVVPYREAALVSGASPWTVFRRISFPLLRPALLSAGLLLILDLSKELTVTLMLRPVGFSSLATLVYEQASQELPHLTALPGLVTIAFTATLCAILYRGLNRAHK